MNFELLFFNLAVRFFAYIIWPSAFDLSQTAQDISHEKHF